MNTMHTIVLLLALLISGLRANPIGTDRPPISCPTAPLVVFDAESPRIDESVEQAEVNTTSGQSCREAGELVRPHWSNNRSAMCPWSYVTDFDADRYPAIISKAVCSCSSQGCLDPDTAQPRPDLRCTPIRYPVPVLRRAQCVDGVSNVVRDFETVTVACACLRPVGHAIRAPDIIG